MTDRETMKYKEDLSRDMDEILHELNDEEGDPFANRIRYTSQKGDRIDEMF